MDTIIAPVNFETVYIHEWGVMTPSWFPLLEKTIEGMTTIILQTDDYREVEYSRF